MEAFDVSRRVNAPANDDPSVLDPPEAAGAPASKERAAPAAQLGLWDNEDDVPEDEDED
jgi:hypothetical protein